MIWGQSICLDDIKPPAYSTKHLMPYQSLSTFRVLLALQVELGKILWAFVFCFFVIIHLKDNVNPPKATSLYCETAQ